MARLPVTMDRQSSPRDRLLKSRCEDQGCIELQSPRTIWMIWRNICFEIGHVVVEIF